MSLTRKRRVSLTQMTSRPTKTPRSISEQQPLVLPNKDVMRITDIPPSHAMSLWNVNVVLPLTIQDSWDDFGPEFRQGLNTDREYDMYGPYGPTGADDVRPLEDDHGSFYGTELIDRCEADKLVILVLNDQGRKACHREGSGFDGFTTFTAGEAQESMDLGRFLGHFHSENPNSLYLYYDSEKDLWIVHELILYGWRFYLRGWRVQILLHREVVDALMSFPKVSHGEQPPSFDDLNTWLLLKQATLVCGSLIYDRTDSRYDTVREVTPLHLRRLHEGIQFLRDVVGVVFFPAYAENAVLLNRHRSTHMLWLTSQKTNTAYPFPSLIDVKDKVMLSRIPFEAVTVRTHCSSDRFPDMSPSDRFEQFEYDPEMDPTLSLASSPPPHPTPAPTLHRTFFIQQRNVHFEEKGYLHCIYHRYAVRAIVYVITINRHHRYPWITAPKQGYHYSVAKTITPLRLLDEGLYNPYVTFPGKTERILGLANSTLPLDDAEEGRRALEGFVQTTITGMKELMGRLELGPSSLEDLCSVSVGVLFNAVTRTFQYYVDDIATGPQVRLFSDILGSSAYSIAEGVVDSVEAQCT